MLTAIELGPKTLTAVTVKLNGLGPEIVQSGTAQLGGLDAEQVRSALAKTGVSGTRGVLVISRGQALFREIELPAGSPDELVAMVRFQVEREMPLPIDQVRYSYVETGRAEGKVRVQVVAVPRDVLDPYVAAVEGAGMKVAGVYVSSFGLLSLYGQTGRAALVEVAGGDAEILVTDQGRMEFSRTAPLDDGISPEQIAREIDRTLLSYGTRGPDREVRQILLAGKGSDAVALAAALGRALNREVTPFGLGTLETATATGVCAGLLRGAPLPDLLHPPVVVRKFRLTRNYRLGALAGGVAFMLLLWSQSALASKRTELENKKKELELLKPRATALSRSLQQTQLANQWYRNRNCWIDLLGALRQNINTSRLWIVSASFEDSGIIRLQGKARDDSNVTDLVAALKKTGKFKDVKADKIDSNKGPASDYRKDFTVSAHLMGFDPKKKL